MKLKGPDVGDNSIFWEYLFFVPPIVSKTENDLACLLVVRTLFYEVLCYSIFKLQLRLEGNILGNCLDLSLSSFFNSFFSNLEVKKLGNLAYFFASMAVLFAVLKFERIFYLSSCEITED